MNQYFKVYYVDLNWEVNNDHYYSLFSCKNKVIDKKEI
jgi:hypothetical protein